MREALKAKMLLQSEDEAFLCFSVRLLADSELFPCQGCEHCERSVKWMFALKLRTMDDEGKQRKK